MNIQNQNKKYNTRSNNRTDKDLYSLKKIEECKMNEIDLEWIYLYSKIMKKLLKY